MAGVPIKFRCFQCNQLLGVSRSKVGTVVTCPRCSTGLVVPEPDEAPPQPLPEAPATTPAFLENLAAGLPAEVADLRPEDIRIETYDDYPPPSRPDPAPVGAPVVAPVVAPPVAMAPAAAPVPEPAPLFAPPYPGPQPGRASPYDVPVAPAPAPAPRANLVPPPAAPAPLESLLPAIDVAAPRLTEERTTHRSRDIQLPRSVVASWSLFVLLAQALAFLAGLLAGHYLWRIH
jgi:hypothetical protein